MLQPTPATAPHAGHHGFLDVGEVAHHPLREFQKLASAGGRERTHLADVAAGAEGLACGLQQHRTHRRVAGGSFEVRTERLAHLDRQGVEFFGAVQRDDRHCVA